MLIVRYHTSIMSKGVPQGCVLSPLTFTLLRHEYSTKFSAKKFYRFVDDTTLFIRLIGKGVWAATVTVKMVANGSLKHSYNYNTALP